MNRKQVRENYFNPNTSPERWDNYRKKYVWRPAITSANPNFKLFDVMTGYLMQNLKLQYVLIVLNPAKRKRAIPSDITFFWKQAEGKNLKEGYFLTGRKPTSSLKTKVKVIMKCKSK